MEAGSRPSNKVSFQLIQARWRRGNRAVERVALTPPGACAGFAARGADPYRLGSCKRTRRIGIRAQTNCRDDAAKKQSRGARPSQSSRYALDDAFITTLVPPAPQHANLLRVRHRTEPFLAPPLTATRPGRSERGRDEVTPIDSHTTAGIPTRLRKITEPLLRIFRRARYYLTSIQQRKGPDPSEKSFTGLTVKDKDMGRYSHVKEGGSDNRVVPFVRPPQHCMLKYTVPYSWPANHARPGLTLVAPTKSQIATQSRKKLPLPIRSKTPNRTDPRGKILARGTDTPSSLPDTEATLALSLIYSQMPTRWRNASAATTGLDPLADAGNYMSGEIEANGTPTSKLSRVITRNLSGHDAVFDGNGSQLEYDFSVAAEPIRLASAERLPARETGRYQQR